MFILYCPIYRYDSALLHCFGSDFLDKVATSSIMTIHLGCELLSLTPSSDVWLLQAQSTKNITETFEHTVSPNGIVKLVRLVTLEDVQFDSMNKQIKS